MLAKNLAKVGRSVVISSIQEKRNMATICAMFCSSEKKIDRSILAVIVPPAILANLKKKYSKLDGKKVVVSFLRFFLNLLKIKYGFFFFFFL